MSTSVVEKVIAVVAVVTVVVAVFALADAVFGWSSDPFGKEGGTGHDCSNHCSSQLKLCRAVSRQEISKLA